MTLLDFWLANAAEVIALTRQHVALVLISTGLATAVGVPLGVLAARRPRLGRVVLGVTGAAQTIPSLALLGFLLPLPLIGGLGPRTALVALSIYALLPIVRTTVTGIRTIDPAIVEAGLAMGMTRRQRTWLVDLPLALPSIVAGVRVATIIGVATTTIAAAIGAGGLGEYIFRGLAMVDSTTILAGAIPAAALALGADALLAWFERHARVGRMTRARIVTPLAGAAALVAAIAGSSYARPDADAVVVGSKNFTEQVVLGEIVAQALEAEGERVVRRLNLGGTFVCDRGIRSGQLDVYVEYTGTAVTAVFNEAATGDAAEMLDRARELYARVGVSALEPLGFNNSFAILVRTRDAEALQLRTIDDLRSTAASWTPGFGYEFLQRNDGYPGLLQAYGLEFGRQPRAMDLSLVYRALAEGQVDVIAGDATSALIDALQLTALDDTRQFFPPYHAVPLVRTSTLLARPGVRRAMERLAGRITERDMRAMNAAVDIAGRRARDVAREFLLQVPQARTLLRPRDRPIDRSWTG